MIRALAASLVALALASPAAAENDGFVVEAIEEKRFDQVRNKIVAEDDDGLDPFGMGLQVIVVVTLSGGPSSGFGTVTLEAKGKKYVDGGVGPMGAWKERRTDYADGRDEDGKAHVMFVFPFRCHNGEVTITASVKPGLKKLGTRTLKTSFICSE